MQFTDRELERMARSRARNILGELERSSDTSGGSIAAKVRAYIACARSTPKSMTHLKRMVEKIPTCKSVSVDCEGNTPGVGATFMMRMKAGRLGFDDDGVLSTMVCGYKDTHTGSVARVFLTEHFVVRLVHRGFNVAEMDMDGLVTTTNALLNTAFSLNRMNDAPRNVPVLLRKIATGDFFTAQMEHHTSDLGSIWVAKTIYQTDDKDLGWMKEVDNATKSRNLQELERLLR